MKTKQVSIYRFAELSDNAKDNVRSWISETNESAEDAIYAIKKIAHYLDFDVRNWSIDAANACISTVTTENRHPEVTGVRLWKWINNNYPQLIEKAENCAISGLWYDYSFIKPFMRFMKKPCKHTNITDLIEEGIEEVLQSMEREYWAEQEDDAVNETCEANAYWFTEDGELTSED